MEQMIYRWLSKSFGQHMFLIAKHQLKQSTWYTTNDATLEITGVQLEVGDMQPRSSTASFEMNLHVANVIMKKSGNGLIANEWQFR